MKKCLLALSVAAAIGSGPAAVHAASPDPREGVPTLDHVFLIVLENHNSFTSFGSPGILDNPAAPHLTAMSRQYNFASNYNGVWHPSLPNYVAMITGDWIGTDVIGSSGPGHLYPPNSVVGISDDDSASANTDLPPPANASKHRWRINLPSLAGQLSNAGKDWRAYLQNLPEAGTHVANWPGDNNTAKLYAVKHNPFPYVAEVQDDPAQFAKQVPIDQLFSDLGSAHVPALSYIVPDQCRDMHGLSNPLAPCGSALGDTDTNDVRRGDDEAFWLVNSITGSPAWKHGRNALFIVFDEGNGPLTCPDYDPDHGVGTAPNSLLPAAKCYDPKNFNDQVVLIAITNYGVKGVTDNHFYTHYSLLKTIEAAFDLPYIGHAADATTHTLAPLLQPED
jgi:phosphatidylinositol-3-phosphatase